MNQVTQQPTTARVIAGEDSKDNTQAAQNRQLSVSYTEVLWQHIGSDTIVAGAEDVPQK